MTQNVNTETEDRYASRSFTVADPRTFDGDPYEVAERGIKQALGVATVLAEMLDAAEKMARNAEMERAFAYHEAPQGSEWPNTPQGKAFAGLHSDIAVVQKNLRVLRVAASYNPRKPPKA